MNSVLSKTFDALDNYYYFRQFAFSFIFLLPILFYFIFPQAEADIEISISIIAFAIVNSLLYPYSRFVYEKIMGFIIGENVFFVDVTRLMIAKFLTMFLCWALEIFIAHIGLGYLYFSYTKNEANKQIPSDG